MRVPTVLFVPIVRENCPPPFFDVRFDVAIVLAAIQAKKVDSRLSVDPELRADIGRAIFVRAFTS